MSKSNPDGFDKNVLSAENYNVGSSKQKSRKTLLHTTKNKIVSLTDFSTTSFLLHEFLGSKCTADFVRFIKNKLHKENLPIRDIIQGQISDLPEEYVSVFEDKFTTLEHTESNCILFSKLLYDLLQYDAVSQKNLLAYLSQQKLSNSIQNSDSYSIFCGLQLQPKLHFSHNIKNAPKYDILTYLLKDGRPHYKKNISILKKHMKGASFFVNGKASLSFQKILIALRHVLSVYEGEFTIDLFLKNRKNAPGYDGRHFMHMVDMLIFLCKETKEEVKEKKKSKKLKASQTQSIEKTESKVTNIDSRQNNFLYLFEATPLEEMDNGIFDVLFASVNTDGQKYRDLDLYQKTAVFLEGVVDNLDGFKKYVLDNPKMNHIYIPSSGVTCEALIYRLDALQSESNPLHSNVCNFILKRNIENDSFDEKHFELSTFYLSLVQDKDTVISGCKNREEAKSHIISVLDQEATIKNQESQLSFREKRDFLEKKFKFRTDLKDPNSIHYEKFRGAGLSPLNESEGDFLTKGLSRKKADRTQHNRESINNIKQGNYPDCYRVGLMCSLLPLNFSKEVLLGNIGKKPGESILTEQNSTYFVYIGNKRISVYPEERQNRVGVSAPELLKIREIAFLKSHGISKIKDAVGPILKKLGFSLLFLVHFGWVMNTDVEGYTPMDTLYYKVIPFLLLFGMSIFSSASLLISFNSKDRSFADFIDDIRSINTTYYRSPIWNDGGHSYEAFLEMFGKIGKTKTLYAPSSWEEISEIYSYLKSMKHGNTSFVVSGLKNEWLDNNLQDDHAYGGISPQKIVDPHNNKGQILDFEILELMHTFYTFEFMKFSFEKMFDARIG